MLRDEVASLVVHEDVFDTHDSALTVVYSQQHELIFSGTLHKLDLDQVCILRRLYRNQVPKSFTCK